MLLIPFPTSGSTFVPTFTKAGTADMTLGANYTIVNKYAPSLLLASGSVVRLTFEGAMSGNTAITAAYIGLAALTGDAWDFASTPTAITWEKATSLTMIKGNNYLSDEITFALDDTVPIMVAMNVSTASVLRYASGLANHRLAYIKSGVSEAATVNKGASYTSQAGYNYIVSKIEVGY